MLVMPSDHAIGKPVEFCKTIQAAVSWAESHDDLITLGIKPSRPETGYGYLKLGTTLAGSCRKVEAFVEKPNLERAQDYFKSGNYLWNGGMFVWRVETILRVFDQYMPEMRRAWEEARGVGEEAYPRMTATSIDYGIMEKADHVVTFPLDCEWDDLGSWISLENLAQKMPGAKQAGSVVTGGELLSIDSKNNIVDAPGKLIALLGVEDLVVVEQGNSILVCHKSRAQDIRLVVDQVKKRRPELG